MKKQNLQDSAVKYFVIIVAFGILYLINQYSDSGSFYRNVAGISYELIGFLVMLWSSWESKVKHPQTWRVGIILISMGLLFQLFDAICVEFPSHCGA